MRITFFHPNKRRATREARDLLAMQARKEARMAHFERFFGPGSTVSAQVDAAPFVDVCIFPPNPLKGRDHTTVATDGLTDLPLFAPGDGASPPAPELFVYASGPDGASAAVRFLRVLARTMADPALRLRPGVPAPAGSVDPALKAQSLQVALLPPLREWKGFESHRFSDGTEARFLWAMLLSPADARTLKEDREGFLSRLGDGPLPFLAPA